jgi:putrescine transport system ATP-binding protein
MALTLAVRPEKIILSSTAPAQTSNCVQGEVREIAYLGSTTVVHLRLEGGMPLRVTTINHDRHTAQRPQAGDRLFASWDENASVVLST